jgi:hypothetical protein
MKVERAKVLAQMTGLRKLAGVGKVDYAVEWSATHLEATGRPLVIMAHHRDVTLGIAQQLTAREVEVDGTVRKMRVGKIIGGMAEAKRTADKDAFQRGELDVLVCSIQAAGVGLTLTAASETLFVERAWRPSDLVQAEDRIWRIGQENKCTIIYLDAANTIDDVIAQMLQNKQSTIAGVIDGLDLDADMAQDFVFGTMFGLQGEVKRVAGQKAVANPRYTIPRIEWDSASSV